MLWYMQQIVVICGNLYVVTFQLTTNNIPALLKTPRVDSGRNSGDGAKTQGGGGKVVEKVLFRLTHQFLSCYDH